jgi:hypothetical protein
MYGTPRCLAFSQVCREWRTAALSSSALWSAIRYAPKHHQFATEMLHRARGSPLTLIYTARGGHVGDSSAIFLKSFAATRWSTARVVKLYGDNDILKLAFEGAPVEAPMLESLSLLGKGVDNLLDLSAAPLFSQSQPR